MWCKEHIKKTANWYLEHYLFNFLMSDRNFLKWRFKTRTGYALNLDSPKTFCEKIQWLKLNMLRTDFTKMVDKIDAKQYVENIIGQEHIIPTIGTWESVEDIDWNVLPNEFVIKRTNDSGGIVICHDKTISNIALIKEKLSSRTRKDYSKFNFEYPYQGLKARIIAEKLMKSGNDAELKDYKFYCFNGRAEYCQVIADRRTDETIDFYDRKWKLQPFIGLNPNVHHASKPIVNPEHYGQMVAIADKIAAEINHPFVRVDLYNINGRIYFGEITFFPNSGMGVIRPFEWDLKLGEMIKLPIDI